MAVDFFKKNKYLSIISLVILFFLSISGFLFFYQKWVQKFFINKNQIVIETQAIQYNDLKDDELGISFKIPKNWGEIEIKNTFYTYSSSIEIIRKISFSNRPNIKFISFTGDQIYLTDFEKQDISRNADMRSFCNSYIEYRNDRETITDDGQDVFRTNGYYSGDCMINPPFINIADKKSTEGIGWSYIDDEPKNATSTIELSRNFFWTLQNEIYGSLVLSIDIPNIASDGFCIKNSDSEYQHQLQNFSCINNKEKDLIDNAFNHFNTTQLDEEINFLVNSLKIYHADTAVLIYENYFKNLAVFKDAGLGISFNYPSVFGEPKYRSTSRRILGFGNISADLFYINIDTLADIIQDNVEAEKEQDECVFFCPVIRSLQDIQKSWEQERNDLAQGSPGEAQCPGSGGYGYGSYRYCEIVNIGNIKMLISYYGVSNTGIVKNYKFFVNDKRFNVYFGNGNGTYDLTEYQKFENTNFAFRLFKEILGSIKIEK